MEHKVSNPNKPTDSSIFNQETGFDLFVRDNDWFISGNVTAAQAQLLLNAHNPTLPAEPTLAEKLAALGLTTDDLKALGLGGN